MWLKPACNLRHSRVSRLVAADPDETAARPAISKARAGAVDRVGDVHEVEA
jgi:hypothetical protein